LQFLIKKDIKKNIFQFLQFLVIKTLDPDSTEMLDPDSDPDSMHPDPQLCLVYLLRLAGEGELDFFLLAGALSSSSVELGSKHGKNNDNLSEQVLEVY
jgi:hypothetical protein